MKNTLCLSAFGYEAEIDPARGANLIRLAKPALKINALRTPESPEDFDTKNPFLFGIPILFPPNRISGARFTFEDREYIFPMNEPKIGNFLHGEIHRTPFDVLERDAVHAVLRFRATPEKPYLTFPHAFTMTVRYELNQDGIRQTVTIRNDSDLNMPLALGFHTTFRIPFAEGGRPEDVRLRLSAGREIVRDMATYLPTGEILSDYEFAHAFRTDGITPCEHTISRHYEMVQPGSMTLCDTGGASIVYLPDENYRYWMVYNGGDRSFLCVEPQTWMNNCPNAPFPRSQTGFDFLKPRESRNYSALIRLDMI